MSARILPLVVLLLMAPAALAAAGPEPVVRVRLSGAAEAARVSLAAASEPVAVRVDGVPRGVLASGASATVAVQEAGVRIALPDGPVFGTLVELDGLVRLGTGRSARTYPGRLAIRPDRSHLQIVNHVPLADYVASVTAAEYGFSEIEGVKAQAVVVRTYAVRRLGSAGTYDLDDHQGSQVYRGLEPTTATTRRATEETAGQVLTYAGRPIDAVYSSSSGGHTASNETVWNTSPVPYLRGVPDPYDADAPDHAWHTSASLDRVLEALSARFGGRVTGFEVAERSVEGRVRTVRLDGARRATVTGAQFRQAVNAAVGGRTLRSTFFSVTITGSEVAFDGRGFGHGVGLSQYGARGQAREGRPYDLILSYYFPGTTLQQIDGAPVDPTVAPGPPLASAEPAPRSETPRRWPTPRAEVRSTASVPGPPPTALPSPPPPARPSARGAARVIPGPASRPAPPAAEREEPAPRRRTAW